MNLGPLELQGGEWISVPRGTLACRYHEHPFPQWSWWEETKEKRVAQVAGIERRGDNRWYVVFLWQREVWSIRYGDGVRLTELEALALSEETG